MTTTTSTRTYVTLEYRLPGGHGSTHRSVTRETVADVAAHVKRYAHGTDFRVRETVTVQQFTTTDITAEVLS